MLLTIVYMKFFQKMTREIKGSRERLIEGTESSYFRCINHSCESTDKFLEINLARFRNFAFDYLFRKILFNLHHKLLENL